jgi:hypothetical protein
VFYGRVSTEDHQDPVASQARQRDLAATLVAGHGRIVAEYFDIGQSRVLPWARRPQATALLAAMADPDHEFDAIVIGEYERAFYGGQYAAMAPLFEHYSSQLWTPEAGGPIDFQAEDHEQLMLVLGWQSKREITRTRMRVRTAMAAPRAAPPTRQHAGTCWPGCCAAGPAAGAWSHPGPAAGPHTDAGTATPAPPGPIRAGRRTSMFARTKSCAT